MNLELSSKLIRKVPLQYGKQTISYRDINAIIDIFLENKYLTTGPKVIEFEKKVAEYTNHKYAIAVNNGTSALHCAIKAIGIHPRDEVIVTTMSFVASANCIVYEGGIPVFADINPETMNIDHTKIEKLITTRTKAIVTVSYTHLTLPTSDLVKIAKKYNLKVIEDGAHSLGAPNTGKFSDLTTFSFHPVKNITTGEGGMIVTSSNEYYNIMKQFRSHGISADYKTRNRHYYDMTELGYNLRLTDFQCALGISQLKRLPEFIFKRNQIASLYNQAFGLSYLSKFATPLKQLQKSAHHIYIIKLNLENLVSNITRDTIYDEYHSNNIKVNVHYKPIHLHTYYLTNQNLPSPNCPIAEEVYQRIITLPIYPEMTLKDVADVIEVSLRIYEKYKK